MLEISSKELGELKKQINSLYCEHSGEARTFVPYVSRLCLRKVDFNVYTTLFKDKRGKDYLALFYISKKWEVDIPMASLNPTFYMAYEEDPDRKYMFVYIPDKLSNCMVRFESDFTYSIEEEVDKIINTLKAIKRGEEMLCQ